MFSFKNITKYRFDLVFSYWIFAWYLLYIFKVVSYSPKLVLCISVIENTIVFMIMTFVLKSSMETILKFLMINTFIKIIPLYSVWSDKIHWKTDVYRIFVLFAIYVIWSSFFAKKIFEKQMNLIKNDKNVNVYNKYMLYILTPITPGMLLYDDVQKYLHKRE